MISDFVFSYVNIIWTSTMNVSRFNLSLPRDHFAMLDTPEDANNTGSEILGPSPLETQYSSEDLGRWKYLDLVV